MQVGKRAINQSAAQPEPSSRGQIEQLGNEHLYYNATYTNGSLTTPARANYLDTRNAPILENPDEWRASVVRFDVSAARIPICVIPTSGGNTYGVGNIALYVASTGNTYTSVITYTDHGFDPLYTPVGSIFTYQQFLDDVNAALLVAYGLIPALDRPAGSAAPQFIYNPVTNLIDLYIDPSYIGTPSTAALVIELSDAIQPYFMGFLFDYAAGVTPYSISIPGSIALVQPAVGSRQQLPFSVAAAPATLLKTSQQSQLVGAWNGVRAVYITTSQVPIVPEYVVASPIVNDNTVSTATQRIISDFLITPEINPLEGRTVFEYLPTAEYRLIDLRGKGPMYTVDLQMFWSDYRGNSYPVYLNPGTTFSVKIMFRRNTVCGC